MEKGEATERDRSARPKWIERLEKYSRDFKYNPSQNFFQLGTTPLRLKEVIDSQDYYRCFRGNADGSFDIDTSMLIIESWGGVRQLPLLKQWVLAISREKLPSIQIQIRQAMYLPWQIHKPDLDIVRKTSEGDYYSSHFGFGFTPYDDGTFLIRTYGNRAGFSPTTSNSGELVEYAGDNLDSVAQYVSCMVGVGTVAYLAQQETADG